MAVIEYSIIRVRIADIKCFSIGVKMTGKAYFSIGEIIAILFQIGSFVACLHNSYGTPKIPHSENLGGAD